MTISSSQAPSLKRPPLSPEIFSKNIAADDPVGPSLRYMAVYDDIRLARQEDDPRLSMGVWKIDLKRADWHKIETLCVDTLCKTSKDLQIAAWLTEAWILLDGLEGYSRGLQTFLTLCEAFWDTIHPQPQEGGDLENRQMIFEWMDNILSSRLLLVPITHSKFEQTGFGLGFLKSAQHYEALKKRDPKKNAAPIDPSKNFGTVEEFQKSLEQTSNEHLEKEVQSLIEATQITQQLKDKLITFMEKEAPSFSQILNTLKEITRLLTTTLQNRAPLPAPEIKPTEETSEAPSDFILPLSSTSFSIQSRQDAYRALERIADFLSKNDPHSLAPSLLRRLIQWENQSALDVLRNLAQTPEEYDMLLKILGQENS